MADWVTHLYLAEKLKPYFNFNERDFQKFKWGCLIPDVNDGFIIEPDIVLSRDETHFGPHSFNALHNILTTFKKYIDDPVIKGIAFHLVVDKMIAHDYYNRAPLDFYLKYGCDADFMVPRWHDIKLYTKRVIPSYPKLDLTVAKEVVETVNRKSHYKITEVDILKVYDILPTLLDNLDDEYKFYKPTEINDLYTRIVCEFVSLMDFN